jgi:hypothetical protein
MKKIIKDIIKKKIPLNSFNYSLNLNSNYHKMQGDRKSFYKKILKKLSFNELCILFKTDKGDLYENIIYDFVNKKYVKSLVVGHGYSKYYETLNNKNIKKIIEIGSYRGSSAAVFKAFFNNAIIHCIDIQFDKNITSHKDIKRHIIDQSDEKRLEKFIVKERLKNKVDLISDDGAHKDLHILTSLKALFKSLKKGGKYFIEDVSKTQTPQTYKLFVKNKKKIFKGIKSIKSFKSNVNPKTQSKSYKNAYLIVLQKK